jgi:YD repeat-containing protein
MPSPTLRKNAEDGGFEGAIIDGAADCLPYTGFGETQTYTAKHGATSLFATSYAYDNAGRITRKTETVQGAAAVYEYAYELAGRLAEVKRDGQVTASYRYDANGNRTHVNGAAVATYDEWAYSTVTDLAKLRGWSTSVPLIRATW